MTFKHCELRALCTAQAKLLETRSFCQEKRFERGIIQSDTFRFILSKVLICCLCQRDEAIGG